MSQGHFVPHEVHTDWVRTETRPLTIRKWRPTAWVRVGLSDTDSVSMSQQTQCSAVKECCHATVCRYITIQNT